MRSRIRKFLGGDGIWKLQRTVTILKVRRKRIPGGRRSQSKGLETAESSPGHLHSEREQAKPSFTELLVQDESDY